MKKRIEYANATILEHLRVLIYEVGTSNEATLMALPPNEQLEVLLMNVQTILDSAKLTNGLRMKGINQSYSMYDAKMFADAQIMKAVLLEEQNEKNQSAVVQKEGGQHMGTINIVTPISEAFHSKQ